MDEGTTARGSHHPHWAKEDHSFRLHQAIHSLLSVWANGPPDEEPPLRKEVEDLLKHPAAETDLDDYEFGALLLCSAQDQDDTIFGLLIGRDGLTKFQINIALHWATANGHASLLRKLLNEDGVEPDKKDTRGRTALSHAAERGAVGTVKALLDSQKVDIDSRDEAGATPLWWAVRSERERVAKLLLARGAATPKIEDDDIVRGILFQAVEHESTTILKILLCGLQKEDRRKHFKCLSSTNEQGRTLLSVAAETGNVTVLEMLFQNCSYSSELDIRDTEGRTAIWWAASKGRDKVLLFLLPFAHNRVAVDAQDNRGITPLSEAVRQWLSRREYPTIYRSKALAGRSEVVKLLLAENLVGTESISDEQLQILLWRSVRSGYRTITDLLAQKDDRVKHDCTDPDDRNGQTLLSWAEENNNKSLVDLLLNKKGSPV